jgi:tryptophanyl-tRNA synthetase
VPVGVDQVPHLEITREICRRFNNFYGEVFPEPEALLTQFPKVPGIDGRKMSKTYNNCIYLSDQPNEVNKK